MKLKSTKNNIVFEVTDELGKKYLAKKGKSKRFEEVKQEATNTEKDTEKVKKETTNTDKETDEDTDKDTEETTPDLPEENKGGKKKK